MKTISQKIATLLLMCLIALTITGYAYSHWADIATIFGTIHTGNLDITICNEKLIPYIDYGKSSNNDSIRIITEITTTPWQIWVGIIIKNNGTVPVTITYQIQATNDIEYIGYFRNETHFYGPYTTVPPEVWDNIDGVSPPPLGERPPPPIDLPVDYKLVVWQNITLTDAPKNFSITITSRYSATVGCWYDTVAVIYDLEVHA